MLEEASSARRAIFAELGVSEDELLKLLSDAEFVAGVKRLKTVADEGASAPVADVLMVAEGDPDDSKGLVPSGSPVAPVVGVEEDLIG